MPYLIPFDSLPWTSPMTGVREKRHQVGARVLRLVEYADSMAPHFCSKGHVGHIVEGVLEIEFKGETVTFRTGDALFIPPGDEHAHRAVAKTPVVTALFVEDAT
jgi:quercetin dioxygenase-like cupin family protein